MYFLWPVDSLIKPIFNVCFHPYVLPTVIYSNKDKVIAGENPLIDEDNAFKNVQLNTRTYLVLLQALDPRSTYLPTHLFSISSRALQLD